MRFGSVANRHRKGPIPTGVDAYHAGRSAMEVCMLGYQKTDGIYTVRATAKDVTTQVYCDMTTDGGGWMLIARTDPRTTGGNVPWGWLAQGTGSVNDYSQAYSLGWVNWHNAGAKFTEYIYGNRLNLNNSKWGPFVYKRSLLSQVVAGAYDGFMTAAAAFNVPQTVVKADPSIYNFTGGSQMQLLQGFCQDVSYYSYFMRDVAGNSSLSYGMHSDGMLTTYVNNTDPAVEPTGNGWRFSGPWDIAGTYNETTFDFNQTDGSGNTHYGGTTQAMIMVRNKASSY